MKRAMILAMVGLLAFSMGCGDDGLSEEDSQTAWMATSTALSQGQSGASQSARNSPADTFNIDYTHNCLEGGSASFVGSLESGSDAGGSDMNFDYTVSFADCVSQGVTINGALTFSMSSSSGETGSTTSFVYQGGVDYSGKVEGGCDIDMTGSTSFTAGGAPGSGSASIQFEGTMCGHDAGKISGTRSF